MLRLNYCRIDFGLRINDFRYMNKSYYHLFLIFAFLILIFGLFKNGADSTIDVNVHDTYYVIEHFTVNLFFSLFSFLIWLIYFLFNHFRLKMANKLILFQFVIYVLSIIGMMFPIIFIIKKNDFNPSLFQDTNFLISLFFGFFLISIILFVIILSISIFNKFKK